MFNTSVSHNMETTSDVCWPSENEHKIKPEKPSGKSKCTQSKKPKKMPKGWTKRDKVYDSGRVTKVFVSPDGQTFDRWSQVETYLKA